MKQKIIDGYRINYNEAISLLNTLPNEELHTLANDLREHFHKKKISTCIIMNAKSGACSEDCKWCSQSKYHSTESSVYKLVHINDVLKDATIAKEKNIEMFSLVTSGKRVSPNEIEQLSTIYNQLKEKMPRLGLCASLGLIYKTDLQKLYNSGVRRYHCNIETAPSFFPTLCSTHTIEEKISTIKSAQETGMTICSGGIIGMGETMKQRIEMAILLQQLKVDSIPVNILQSIKGTPLENTKSLTDEEILKSFAMFRIINPTADIRFAGGRTQIKHVQDKALKCGISASLVGDMLTTIGSKIDEDFTFFKQHGYDL